MEKSPASSEKANKLPVASPKILIAGLGNLLLRDDGVGVQAVRQLLEAPPLNVQVIEVGTAVLDALPWFEWADRIIALDAMQAGGAPGTIYQCETGDIAEGAAQSSLHELSLLAALRFLPSDAKPEVIILAVEPEIIDFGLELSSSVKAALPGLIQAAADLISCWLDSPS
jgi:hydrogenase maturation protease